MFVATKNIFCRGVSFLPPTVSFLPLFGMNNETLFFFSSFVFVKFWVHSTFVKVVYFDPLLHGNFKYFSFKKLFMVDRNRDFCPSITPTDYTSLNREFKEMLVSLKQCISGIGPLIPDIIIGGDFNLPRISWNDGVAIFLQGCPKAIKELNHSLHDCCNDLFLKLVVEHATHKDGNVLDLILTNNTDLVHELNINDTLLSITHHKIIQVSTSYKTKCKLHKNRKVPPLTSLFQKFNFHSNTISWEDVACELNDYSWEAEFQEKNLDEMLKLLYDLF